MRIVTNPGSNLDEDTCLRLDIDLLPQKIVVDGIPRDTRNTVDFTQVDDWVKKAHKHPMVQGTTEKDFTEYLGGAVKKDAEVLAVMTSRKLIGSHDAVVQAARAVKSGPDAALQRSRVEVVDSLTTDVGAGLCTLAAVSARKAGLDLSKTAQFVRAFAERGRTVIGLATLDNLIKGGKASSLQGFVANFLNIRPLLGMNEGALESVAKISAKADLGEKMVEHLADRLDAGKPVWVAVAHGNVPQKAAALEARLRERFRCEYVLNRPLSSSIYLHGGPGALWASVYPLEGLAHRPTAA